MTRRSGELIAEMLEAITRRYVLDDRKIPADVLALKDEIMEIFAKAQSENDPAAQERYEQRLREIHEIIIPGG